jgi:hypothetical protein
VPDRSEVEQMSAQLELIVVPIEKPEELNLILERSSAS